MAFKRILIVGASGMLGRDLTADLRGKGYEVAALSSSDVNLLHPIDAIERVIARHTPEIIIHAAAFTDVDAAERDPEVAMTINKDGTRKLAVIARDLGAILAYISTDYVFDGNQRTPYTIADKPNPINAYGVSKYYGELMVQEILETAYIIRTSWLYGQHRHNFVQFVLDGARQGRPLRVVNDWTGSPTWTGSLSHQIERIVTSGAYGMYHACDRGAVSKFEQAQAICRASGLSTDHIQPASFREFSFTAQRPAYSALNPGELSVPSWETSLQGYLTQILPSPSSEAANTTHA